MSVIAHRNIVFSAAATPVWVHNTVGILNIDREEGRRSHVPTQFNNGQGTTFGQVARGGFADSFYLGFNLARKFV
jgi:hypothetical protein